MSTVPKNDSNSVLLRLWPWVATFCLLVTIISAVATAIMYITHATGSGAVGGTAKQVTYGLPITITKGGTYRGNWQSTSPDIPAVKVITTEPVVIENSHIKGPGDLIQALDGVGHNITVRNTFGFGINPNVAEKTKGAFLHISSATKIVVEHCSMQDTNGGIFIDGYAGNNIADQTITIRYNRSLNMDGRRSDGKGGYLPAQKGQVGAYFVRLSHSEAVSGVDISWNEMVVVGANGLSKNAAESAIILSQSSGTATSLIRIHDNYTQGTALNTWPTDANVQVSNTITQRSVWQESITRAKIVIGPQ